MSDDADAARGSWLGNATLRRAQLAFGAAGIAETAATVALGLIAYADGGAAAVGLVGLVRLVPAALLAPVLAAAADRRPRHEVLRQSSLVRGLATLLAGLVLAADGPVLIVYGLAALATIAFTPFRAAHSALLPSLCQTTEELTRANVVRGGLDSLSVLVGPLAAAGLVAVADEWTVLVLAGLAALGSAALLTGLAYERLAVPDGPRDLRAEVTAGLRALRTEPGLELLAGLAVLQCFIRGALGVFVVVVCLDLLPLGESGVGLLQAVMGVGAVVGSIAAARLVGSGAMARWFGVAVACWGLPLALLGGLPGTGTAVLALAVVGAANATVDVALFTALGRMVPDAVLARALGVLESLFALAVGVGGVITPPLISGLGVEGALVAVGLTAPVAVGVAWAALGTVDRGLVSRSEDIALLRRVAMLRPLPVPVVEQLARGLERLTVPAGQDVVRAGDVGTAFFVIETGRARVLHGEALVRELGPGAGFGEIALLRDVPRTVTVRAEEELVLGRLERAAFLPAVMGFTASHSAASASMAHYEHL